MVGYFPAIVFGILIATYLDLYFVGNHLYSFPIRWLPDIFNINIAFNLIALPLLIFFYLSLCEKLDRGWQITFILVLSLLMCLFEKLAEAWGLFIHSPEWSHFYTFLGYTFFLALVLTIKQWTYYPINK